jgi:hypothetical protein
MVVKWLAQICKYIRVGHFCVTGHAPGCRQGSDDTMCSIAGEICCSTRAQYSVSWLGLNSLPLVLTIFFIMMSNVGFFGKGVCII